MQLSNTKGSVLIWSIFLSVIVAISFMSISTKIHKTIKSGGEISNFIDEKNNIESALKTKQNSIISDKTFILFEEKTKSIFGLKNGEEIFFSFEGNTDFNIDLGILEGGGVEYSYSEIDFTNGFSAVTSSGVLNYSHSFSGTLSNTYTGGLLTLTNHGGYTKMFLKSSLNFEHMKKKYKIIKKIGNHTVVQSQGNID